jgi:hypothetical protein
MRVVDTSIWIEWLINSPLNPAIAESFPEATDCIIPTIMQLEPYKTILNNL